MTETVPDSTSAKTDKPTSLTEIFFTFLLLGCTSFGGPVAHLGYFREEFVGRKKWLEERAYADLVALCQFLPGPASSQVGIGVGLSRGGLPGAFLAWFGFTMPSALALIAFGYGVTAYQDDISFGVLHGLKVVAVAVVAQAVWSMARSLCPDARRASLAVLSACAVLATPHSPDASRSDRAWWSGRSDFSSRRPEHRTCVARYQGQSKTCHNMFNFVLCRTNRITCAVSRISTTNIGSG